MNEIDCTIYRVLRGVVPFLGAILFLSCSGKIVRDDAPAPIENGQGRLETIVCGHHAVGDNICWVDSGDSLADIDVSVLTVFSGSLTIKSVDSSCSIDKSVSYSNFEEVRFTLGDFTQNFHESCIVDLVMYPVFPGQNNSEVSVKGWSGRIVFAYKNSEVDLAYVKGTDNYSEYSDDSLFYDGVGLVSVRSGQINGSSTGLFSVDVGDSYRGKVRLSGCSILPFVKEYSGGSVVDLSIKEVLDGYPEGPIHCVLYGRAVRMDRENDSIFMILVEAYSENIVFLDVPVVNIEEDVVEFYSNDPVSWTMIDDELINDGYGEAIVKDPYFYYVRQFTSAGRTRVMKFSKNRMIWIR